MRERGREREREGETSAAYGARRPVQFKKQDDSEGRELETCYEKMRRWRNSRTPIRPLGHDEEIRGHAPASSPPPLSLHPSILLEVEGGGVEAHISGTILESNFPAMIYFFLSFFLS